MSKITFTIEIYTDGKSINKIERKAYEQISKRKTMTFKQFLKLFAFAEEKRLQVTSANTRNPTLKHGGGFGSPIYQQLGKELEIEIKG